MKFAALARVLEARGALYATHSRGMRSDLECGPIEEAIDLGRETGVTVEFSPHGYQPSEQVGKPEPSWCRSSMTPVRKVLTSSLTFTLTTRLRHHSPNISPLGSRRAGPRLFGRGWPILSNAPVPLPTCRMGGSAGFRGLWDRFVISHSPDGYGVASSLADLSEEAGTDPHELTIQLCEKYGNELHVVLFYRTEEDMETFLAHPLAVVGSDGNAISLDQPVARPHPRSFGTFPRVLGRYVREKNVLTLVEAIRKE